MKQSYKPHLLHIGIAITIAVILFWIIGWVSGYVVTHWLMPQPWVRFTLYEGFASVSLMFYALLFAVYILCKKTRYTILAGSIAFFVYLLIILPIQQIIETDMQHRFEDHSVEIIEVLVDYFGGIKILFGIGRDHLFSVFVWQLLYLILVTYAVKLLKQVINNRTVRSKKILLLLSSVSFFCSCNTNEANQNNKVIALQKEVPTLCWTDFRVGGLPPQGAYDGIDSLVRKWNLCYERIENGCEVSDSVVALQKHYDSLNNLYFKSLEPKYGKNWKQQFDAELHLLDSINWTKISQENSLNQ